MQSLKTVIAKMEFRNKDPGAVQFGNFINYYQFNSAEERLKLLPKDVWLNKDKSNTSAYFVLDVGCNSGVFTQLLYEYLPSVLQRQQNEVFILGIDIDEKLIERACAENKHPDNVSYLCVDVMDAQFEILIEKFLKQHQQNGSKIMMFDAICCFSITMWIHLNHNDEGLKNFLYKLSNLAHLFVVEPQPWKCYQTAERRLKKAGEEFPLFLKLQWRSNVEHEIQKYLEESLNRRKVAECDPTKWKRRICFYR